MIHIISRHYLLFPAVSFYVLPAILVQNLVLAYSHPVMNKINNIVGKSIGAKKGKDGVWYSSLGQPITKMKALSGLLKSLAVNGVGKSKIVSSIANRIKRVGEDDTNKYRSIYKTGNRILF